MWESIKISHIVIAIIVGWFLITRLKIASEQQRFGIFQIGRFQSLKGPGIFLNISGSVTKWIRVTVGDRGELVAPGAISMNKFHFPVEIDEKIPVGSLIRVTGFNESSLLAMYDPSQVRKINCEKCGHEMKL